MDHVKVFEVRPLSLVLLGRAPLAERTYRTESSFPGLVRRLFIDTQPNCDSCVGLWECSKQAVAGSFVFHAASSTSTKEKGQQPLNLINYFCGRLPCQP